MIEESPIHPSAGTWSHILPRMMMSRDSAYSCVESLTFVTTQSGLCILSFTYHFFLCLIMFTQCSMPITKHIVDPTFPASCYLISLLYFAICFFRFKKKKKTEIVEYSCFTMLCLFLLYGKMNQLCVYKYPLVLNFFLI